MFLVYFCCSDGSSRQPPWQNSSYFITCMWCCVVPGAIYNSTTTDQVSAAFSYETMNSFRFTSQVRLEQTSMTADTTDSYSVSAACKQNLSNPPVYRSHIYRSEKEAGDIMSNEHKAGQHTLPQRSKDCRMKRVRVSPNNLLNVFCISKRSGCHVKRYGG